MRRDLVAHGRCQTGPVGAAGGGLSAILPGLVAASPNNHPLKACNGGQSSRPSGQAR